MALLEQYHVTGVHDLDTQYTAVYFEDPQGQGMFDIIDQQSDKHQQYGRMRMILGTTVLSQHDCGVKVDARGEGFLTLRSPDGERPTTLV